MARVLRFGFLVSTCVLAIHACSSVRAQSISGVINTYVKVVAVDTCLNTATVTTTNGFAAGDRVLIIQMNGATIDQSNTSGYGTILSLGSAGLYEFATILSLPDAKTVRFANKLLNVYQPDSGAVQLVRVPRYQDVTVTDTLRSIAWDPSSGIGGVIALEVLGTLTIAKSDLPIADVSGLGFLGGAASWSGGTDSIIDFTFDGWSGPLSAEGGYKGEGISKWPLEYDLRDAGRGAPSTGGGGGNAHNAGGGGGANFRDGGRGGDQTNAPGFGRFANGGQPGLAVVADNAQRIYMGGGGGGGHQNDHGGTDGARGGGIIILRAHKIVGDNIYLVANGGSVLLPSTSDGAGGGGAGGTIVLINDSVINSNGTKGDISLEANGGTGGNADAANAPYAYGPGGGGSGGMLHRNAGQYGVGFVRLNGGKAGSVLNCTDAAFNGSQYGAMAGDFGADEDTLEAIPESTTPYIYPFALEHSVSVCAGDSVAISATGGDSYRWSPASPSGNLATVMIAPAATTTYQVLITKGGCTFQDTVHVSVMPKPLATITGPTTICYGVYGTYTSPHDPYTSYAWTVTGGTPQTAVGELVNIAWNPQGPHTIQVTGTNPNCSASSQIAIDVLPEVVPSITATQTVLSNPGDRSILSTDNAYTSYHWSTGDNTPTTTVLSPGRYYVTVTDANGCIGSDSVDILGPAGVPSIELSVPQIEAYPGDHIALPIQIIRSQNMLGAGISTLTYIVHFNKTLLAPADRSLAFTINGEQLTISKTIATPPFASINLDTLELIAALGDTTETEITIDTVIWNAQKPVSTTLDAGHFTLLGICPAGGNRLFSESGRILLSTIVPDPVGSVGYVTYSLAEPGPTSISVVDILGRFVQRSEFDGLPGDYKTSIDANTLANGLYTIVLRTPSQTLTTRMQVQH